MATAGGEGRTDLLREVQQKREGKGTLYFEPLHVQYIPLLNEVIKVVETQVSEINETLFRFG